MIDLHTHSIFSDGELIPAEVVRRAAVKGYRAIAITDHMDASNMDFIIPRVVKIAGELNGRQPVKVIPGAELTHVLPEDIERLSRWARELGAEIVVVHGETIVEPVMKGTNRAAIEAGVDILAHPGLIDEEDVALAAQRGVSLELSARKGHSLANGHVACLALKHNAPLVIDTDAHSPGDLIDRAFAEKVIRATGLDASMIEKIFGNAARLAGLED